MQLTLVEDDKYYYDQLAADNAVKFIESYCVHWQGTFAGKPFNLLGWQKQLVQNVFGWKHKATSYRRFKYIFAMLSKGSGKSPMLAAIGLKMLLSENDPGAQLWSVAADYKQANISFKCARNLIDVSPKLKALVNNNKLKLMQHSIDVPGTHSSWGIFSGDKHSKEGFCPSFIGSDEISFWGSGGWEMYSALEANMEKRPQSLFMMVCNCGKTKTHVAYDLYEKSLRVLADPSIDETWYPVIYSAPEGCEIDDEAALLQANPSAPEIVSIEKLVHRARQCRGNVTKQNEFRRLWLSQWVTDTGEKSWINMSEYDRCVKSFDLSMFANIAATKEVKEKQGPPLWMGLDLSEVDDLTALSYVFNEGDHLFCKTKQMTPAATARKYQERNGIPYSDWAGNKKVKGSKHIHLLASPTIDRKAQKMIVKTILKAAKIYNLKGVCYDPWKAKWIIKKLEDNGITCISVEQSFKGLSGACSEFERRIKEQTISFTNDPCLRWQVGNAEIIPDRIGNIRVVKPGRTGKSAGNPSAKIDSVVAILNAVSAQMREAVASEEIWQGEMIFV